MAKQQGRGGLGSHKHGVSGHAPRSPAYKAQQTREVNRLAEEEKAKRPKPATFASIAEAVKASRPK